MRHTVQTYEDKHICLSTGGAKSVAFSILQSVESGVNKTPKYLSNTELKAPHMPQCWPMAFGTSNPAKVVFKIDVFRGDQISQNSCGSAASDPKSLTKGLSKHGKHTSRMIMKELFRLALEQGGDAAIRALGHAEAELSRNPGHRLALVYKGALLTMVGEALLSTAKRREYIRAGISTINAALDIPGCYPAVAWELEYVRAGTLAMAPPEMGHDSVAYDALRALVASDEFDLQDPFERARCLCLLSCEAEHFGHKDEARQWFTLARAIDEDLVVKTYSDWVNRAENSSSNLE